MSNYIFPGQNDCDCNDPISENCQNCEENLGCPYPSDFECLTYTGTALPCINVETNDKGNAILQSINDIICSIVSGEADYSGYNTYCLAPISTQQQFVETISQRFCNLETAYNTFINTTYPANQTIIDGRLDILEVPQITGNSCLTFLPGDTQKQTIQKIADKVGDLCAITNISSVDWDLCFTVDPIPTTIGQGFNVVLGQICNLNTAIEDIVAPTYTVIANGIDTNPGTLDTKIITSGCITKSVVSDGGQLKLQIGLGFTPSLYTFNSSHFDVSATGTSGCQNTFTVSLKNDIIEGGTVDCESISEVFQPNANPGIVTTSLYGGSNTGGCLAATNCQVMQMLFSDYDDGDYVITIDTAGAENLCDQYKLTPFSSGTVSSVGLTQTNTSMFAITGSPVTTSGNLGLGLATQAANLIFAGPTAGAAAVPNFRSMVTADITDNIVTYGKIQQATGKRLIGNFAPALGNVGEISIGANLALSDAGVLSATGGGYTPISCWGQPYQNLDVVVPASGSNLSGDLSYVFVNYTDQVSSLLTGRESQSVPQYIFDAANNLCLLGTVSLEITSTPTTVVEDILIPFFDAEDFWDSECTLFNKYINKLIGTYIVQTGVGTFGYVEAYLCLNQTVPRRFDLLLKARSATKFTDVPLVIALDSLMIPLFDNN